MDRPSQDRDAEQERTGEAEQDRHGPDLEEHERRHASSAPTPPDARVIHEIIREDGEKELERSVNAIAWSALGAGLSMGFSFFPKCPGRSWSRA